MQNRRVGRRGLLRAGLIGGGAMLALPRAVRADGAPAVDLQLLLAVDASASIDQGILGLQLDGHAAAFRHPAVPQAIAAGPQGRIAVMLAQFAGPETLTTLVPWAVLSGAEDCAAFASRIETTPGVAMGGSTALGSAILTAVERLEAAPFGTARRTLDLVSNGFSNAGISPLTARAHAAAVGVTVNGLAIRNEYDWLDGYFEENIIAGPGAFVRTAAGPADFATAFLAKLVTEIA